MEASQKQTVESKLLVMWIIWGAMVVSLGVYIAICVLIGDKVRQTMGEGFPLVLIRNILFGISIVELIATHFIRKLMMREPEIDPGSISAPEPVAQEPVNIHGKYLSAMVVSLALCESIGIYGLVLFFLGDSVQTMYTFMAVSAAGMLFHRPKREDLEELSLEY
ncbi:hypothetical protein ACFL1N_08520 [Thermodesulfobacteriota bacterium]